MVVCAALAFFMSRCGGPMRFRSGFVHLGCLDMTFLGPAQFSFFSRPIWALRLMFLAIEGCRADG